MAELKVTESVTQDIRLNCEKTNAIIAGNNEPRPEEMVDDALEHDGRLGEDEFAKVQNSDQQSLGGVDGIASAAESLKHSNNPTSEIGQIPSKYKDMETAMAFPIRSRYIQGPKPEQNILDDIIKRPDSQLDWFERQLKKEEISRRETEDVNK